MPVEALVDRRELVDRAADRAAGAGRVLHQEPRRVGAELEHLLHRRQHALEAGFEPAAEMRADVEDDAVRADRAGDLHRVPHRGDRLLVDRRPSASRSCRGRARDTARRRSRPRPRRSRNRSKLAGSWFVGRHVRGLCVKTCTDSAPIRPHDRSPCRFRPRTRCAPRSASARATPRVGPPRPRPRGARRAGCGANGSTGTVRLGRQLAATTPSTSKVGATSPFLPTTSVGALRQHAPPVGDASKRLSHFGRKRTGAGVSAGGSGARGRSSSSRPSSSRKRRSGSSASSAGAKSATRRPDQSRCRRVMPGRTRRGSGGRSRSRAASISTGSGSSWPRVDGLRPRAPERRLGRVQQVRTPTDVRWNTRRPY